MENNEAEKKRERKLLDYEWGLRKLSDFLKHNNIHFMEVSEEKEGEQEEEGLFEHIIAGNVPILGRKDTPHPDSIVNSCQHQQKQANTKTYCSQICKILKDS